MDYNPLTKLPGKWKEQQAGAAHQMKEKDDCDVASLMF
jgi:hypothetical protein